MKRNTFLETITAIAFLVFLGIFLYYAFYPFKITTLNSIGIDRPEYCRGEWVKVNLDFQKHMDIQAEIKWYIVDGVVYQLDSPGISRPAGQNIITVSKQVPHSILPGVYNLRLEMKYLVHPLHNPIVDSWNTPKFVVKEDKDCPASEELELGEPDGTPLPADRLIPSSPEPEIILYPVQAQEQLEVENHQDNTIVVPDRSEEPKGEPQTPVPPTSEPVKGLIDKVLDIL